MFKKTKEQKAFAWGFIIFGITFSLTIIGLVVGIPLIIIGIILLKKEWDSPLFNWIRNQELLRKKLELKKK